ncbi:MAG: 3-oxoacyl-[acyl-carrier-protein] synthase III C-terminal domain-containing protein [Simkaniaceae bacterium]|nr:3-oxoacyl-[acyl-carrier-protein] synthase III C-terminal domain-containing protein [Candidatus Sacchlamyda saccharinae]
MNTINFEILSSGAYVPPKKVLSEMLERKLGYEPGTIAKASGVNSRYHVSNETTSEMGAIAAQQALDSSVLEKDQIDAIVFVGGVPQQAIPSTAALIHAKLGLENTVAFDLNATCLGFVNGLFLLGNLIAKGVYDNVLIVSADIASTGLNPNDPKTASLFGDGAAAFVLGRSDCKGIMSHHFETLSQYSQVCKCEAGGTLHGLKPKVETDRLYFRMDGPRLVKAAMKPLLKMFRKLSQEAQNSINLFIPHQASPLALDLVQKKLKIGEEQFVHIVREYGNMISTSIPFALHKVISEGKLKRGDRVMLFGTAAGLTIGGVVLEY